MEVLIFLLGVVLDFVIMYRAMKSYAEDMAQEMFKEGMQYTHEKYMELMSEGRKRNECKD